MSLLNPETIVGDIEKEPTASSDQNDVTAHQLPSETTGQSEHSEQSSVHGA